MAGRVVLASVELDDLPALSSQERLRRGFTVLEGGASQTARTMSRDWQNTGRVFDTSGTTITNRMFSMRTAAVALLGSFTVAGVILGMKRLVEEAAKGDEAFKSMSISAGQFHEQLLKSIRALPGFHEALVAIDGTLLRMAATARVFQQLMTGTGTLDLVKAFSAALGQLQQEHAARLAELGVMWSTGLRDVEFYWDEVTGRYISATATFRDVTTESGRIIEENIAAGEQWGEMASRVFPSIVDRLNETGGAFQSLEQAAGTAFAAILAGQDIDLSGFVHTVLASISAQAATKAIFEFAEGLAASARYAASYGFDAAAGVAAGLHYRAAAQYLAVAAVAGLGARAVGGGGGRGRENAGGIYGAPQSQPSRSQTINVTIEGNVDSDERVRTIVEQISRALRDGASGGNFNDQLARAS